jgi:type III restriction enzyme
MEESRFFERPILNSPYEYPGRQWELDQSGQPTQRISDTRRRAEFIAPIPKPRKQKGGCKQESLLFDEGNPVGGKMSGSIRSSRLGDVEHPRVR